MRLDDAGWFDLEWRHRRLTKRDRMKLVQQGWRDFGIYAPRGTLLPDVTIDQFRHYLHIAAAKLHKK